MRPNPFKRLLSPEEKETKKKQEEDAQTVKAHKVIRTHFKNGNKSTDNLILHDYSSLPILPENIKCNVISLVDNKYMQEFPLIQANEIYLTNTKIKKIQTLPMGLECEELHLTGNDALTHLPKVKAKFIDLSFTKIRTISEDLECEQLDLTGNIKLNYLPRMKSEWINLSETNVKFIGAIECVELVVKKSYLSKNYTEEEIRQMIKEEGGRVIKLIF